MRNILSHGYADVEDEELWKVVEHDLKPLKECVQRMMNEMP